ncbi:MAG: hemerythrin domain-containing protein [Candidatus Omnitrophica bacterium]|nr:hemerythrin domain-containing protein [Candidatus Omnitrophota bacterium]
MRAIDRLKRDHAILRAKLDVLESALKLGPEAWFVLREVCFTLARQIRDHLRREEALIAVVRTQLDPTTVGHIRLEHQDEPQHLQTINRLFITEQGQSLDRIRPELTRVIEGLRHHMDEEEAQLFPALEQVLGARDVPWSTGRSPHLEETMTVNRVMQQYPQARGVFERLFVNVPYEGCTCLDEVAWRRGLESRELLERLEQVIGMEDT